MRLFLEPVIDLADVARWRSIKLASEGRFDPKPMSDTWLYFSRFIECLCLGYAQEDMADAAHWHERMMA